MHAHDDRLYQSLASRYTCIQQLHVSIDCQLNQQSYTFVYLHARSIKFEISCAFVMLHTVGSRPLCSRIFFCRESKTPEENGLSSRPL